MRSHCGTCLVQNDQNAGAHGFAPVLFAAAWCWKYQVSGTCSFTCIQISSEWSQCEEVANDLWRSNQMYL